MRDIIVESGVRTGKGGTPFFTGFVDLMFEFNVDNPDYGPSDVSVSLTLDEAKKVQKQLGLAIAEIERAPNEWFMEPWLTPKGRTNNSQPGGKDGATR